jgi:signal transduction histidine kinase/ActR/RegA family two-component response regulator
MGRPMVALHQTFSLNDFDFETLFKVLPYPCLIMDSDFLIVDANLAYFNEAAIKRRELRGQNFFDATGLTQQTHALEHAQIRPLLQSVITAGQTCAIPFSPSIAGATTATKPSSRPALWQTTAIPLRGSSGAVDGIMLHSVPATHSAQHLPDTVAQTPEPLNDAELVKKSLLAAKVGIWQVNLSRNTFTCSPNAQTLLGVVPDALADLVNGLHPNDRARFTLALEHACIQKSSLLERLRLIRADNGVTIWLDIHAETHTDDKGEVVALKGFILDVTDHITAAEKLQLADRQKDDFLAMLSHELRNPLAPISSAAQLMTLAQPNQEQVEQTGEIITRQVRHMAGLVNNLLDASRVTHGLITTEKSHVDLKHIIYTAIEQSTALIQARQHQLNIDLTPEDVTILGDQHRLVQVLTHLLTNAAKYTPNGGTIRVQLSADKNVATIKVVDNGAGFTDELLPRIFEPFAQAERSPDRSQGGLGIGLALVKSLVELHGGTVSAFSDGRTGSKFTVQLPRVDVPVARTAAPHKLTDEPLRILVVDDNEDAANTLAQVLKTLGHNTSVAYDARGAIEAAVEQEQDVFLLDIGLPEMDGNALVRYLRAQAETSEALIIAITGYGAEENKREAMAAGFDEYLVKPVDITELEQLISQYRLSQTRPLAAG